MAWCRKSARVLVCRFAGRRWLPDGDGQSPCAGIQLEGRTGADAAAIRVRFFTALEDFLPVSMNRSQRIRAQSHTEKELPE